MLTYIGLARISAYEVGIFPIKNVTTYPTPSPTHTPLRSHLSSSPMSIFSRNYYVSQRCSIVKNYPGSMIRVIVSCIKAAAK